MTLAPVLITPPAGELVSVADAKLHCRVDYAEDDLLISGLISAAIGHLDAWGGVLGRCIMPQAVSYTHLTLPTTLHECRSRWSPYH